MIKAFIFDLDGVITETSILHFEAWKKIVKKHLGINYSKEENDSLKGLSRKDTLLQILKLHNLDKKLTEVKINELCEIKNNLYKEYLKTKLTKEDILPKIKELLLEAKKHKLKLGIASSSHNAPIILKTLEIYDLFDYISNPATIKNGKPAPDIYLDVMNHFELKPNECVGFEDAIAGVQGLVSAKMYVVAFTYGVKENWKIADLIYQETKDINFKEIMNLKGK
ncbi:beta-phosphoglucomutase [[Mycoplasma] mobile]|uniref:Beta-phosphoglucomutase n=1 Tax=Mycoplasma mobile (strain ATCC 43663 / 163K / NCTC 11711) TaxID=267748 RepID=Q6KHP8_MYCM1|nr:beta-phosphoglucomutase [[Mycoplasma] mobile]AAT27882.1 beta-phosphoglucomutase [Mycoplasma mobile 163K]